MKRWPKYINRGTILAVVAMVVLVACSNWMVLLVFASALLLGYIYREMRGRYLQKEEESAHGRVYQSMEEAVAALGDPDESITTDATRANELSGAVLVYKQHGLLVVAGEEVNLADIADVNVVNRATPYTVGQHQIVFTLRRKDNPYVRIDVGYDAEYAGTVAEEIMSAISEDAPKSSQASPTEESSRHTDDADSSVLSE